MKNKEIDTQWEAIRAARAEVGLLDTAAPVGVTVRQYAQKYGLPYVSAGQQLRRMVEQGLLVATRVRAGYPARVLVCYSPARKKKL